MSDFPPNDPTGPYGPPPSPPPPGYYPPPPPGYVHPSVPLAGYYAPPQPRKPDPNAIALEGICALFGIYGVGWMMSGKTQIGIPLLIGGLIWMAIAIVGTLLTAFLGACCFIPLHIIFIATSTLLLANQTLP